MGDVTRDTLLQRIADLLGGDHEGALLLTGLPGSGKSFVLRRAAAASPIRSVHVQVNPAEDSWPLSGLSGLVAAVDPRAAEFAGRYVLRSAEPAALQAAAADVLGLLRGLRLDPVAVFIDDLDQMDAASRALLGFMAGRFAGTGVRIVATATRLQPNDPLAGFPRSRIAPLKLAESLALLAETDPDLDPGTAWIIARHGGGNAAAILHHLERLSWAQRSGRASLRLPAAPAPSGRVAARTALAASGMDLAELLHALAISPVTTPAVLVAAGLGSNEDFDDLLRAGLAAEADPYLRVRDPIVRTAVAHDLPGGMRRTLHERLRDACLATSDELAVWHASFLDEDTAAPDLLGLAESLLTGGFLDAAIEVADRALLHRGPTLPVRPAIEFARQLLRREERDLAARVLIRIGDEQLPRADRAAQILAKLEVELARVGRLSESDVGAVVEFYGEADPPGASAVLASAALTRSLDGDVTTARSRAAAAVRFLPAATGEVRRLAAAAGAVLAAFGGERDRGAPPDPLDASPPELVAWARAASVREDDDTAIRWFVVALDRRRDEHPGWQAVARVFAADHLVRAGRLDEALPCALGLDESRLPPAFRPLGQVVTAWATAARDRIPEARTLLRRCLAAQRNGGLARIAAHGLLGELALLEGDPAAAVTELAQAEYLAAEIGNPGVVRFHPDLIEALLATGQRSAAREALARYEAAAGPTPGPWTALALARSRAMLADPQSAVASLDRVLRDTDPAANPLERARLLRLRAMRLQQAGSPSASGAMAEARAAFEVAGAGILARRLSGAGRPNGAPDSPLLDLLSPVEAEVARLVREGYHNKEIAARLFVSVRTVELRLTHIYRKTGARSRSHLVAALT